jgi:hypothetical protein
MTSFTAANQFEFEKVVGERDARFVTNWKRKRELREGIKEPSIHPGECLQQFLGNKKLTDDVDADYTWKNGAREGANIGGPKFSEPSIEMYGMSATITRETGVEEGLLGRCLRI